MSKRFGRNQRRKMRDQITLLEFFSRKDHERMMRLDLEYHDLQREMQSWESRLHKALHPDNALHREIREKKVREMRPEMRAHVPEALLARELTGRETVSREQILENMRTYVLHIEDDPNDYSRLIQWRELINGDVWAYKISDMTMRTCPDYELLARHVAGEMIEVFKADIERERAR